MLLSPLLNSLLSFRQELRGEERANLYNNGHMDGWANEQTGVREGFAPTIYYPTPTLLNRKPFELDNRTMQ